jgi:hypothetical protein
MTDLLFASHTQRRAVYAVERDGGLFEVLGDVSTPTVRVRLFGGIGFCARARAGAVQQDRGSGPNYRVHAAEQESWSPSFRPS